MTTCEFTIVQVGTIVHVYAILSYIVANIQSKRP